MVKTKRSGNTVRYFTLAAVVAIGALLAPAQVIAQGTNPGHDSAESVRLVGYHDMQGRQALQLTAKSDATNGNWLYVGYQPNARPDYDGSPEPQMNSITGQAEINGTGIFDITDPSKPRLVWHIPGNSGANHRSVSVVYDYKYDGSGNDYLIRSSDDGADLRFEIFDITTRGTDPSKITKVAEIRGTPPNSCGPGCGGAFAGRAHKGYWSEESGRYYSSSGEPGFRGISILHIWDLTDPKNPTFISRGWFPGQKETEPESTYDGAYVHHPIVDEANNRVYAGARNTSGKMQAWDISDVANPKVAWLVDTKPPGRGPHTMTPIVYHSVPNIGAKAMPRTYFFMTDEAGGGADMAPCTDPIRTRAYMFDITHESHPTQVSQWEVPVGDFCKKGGRFGPHQHAEFVNGKLNRHEDRIAWVAYFNAGVRVLDLSNPFQMREIGYYIPKTNAASHPMAKGQPSVIQINDVTLDHRGIAYATDRVGTGLFILEYTGPKPVQTP
jgi:hypothetical protein